MHNEYIDKISHYNNSQYKWIKQFCSENPVWDDSMIEERANMMAETYYQHIIGKENNWHYTLFFVVWYQKNFLFLQFKSWYNQDKTSYFPPSEP